MYTLEEVQKHNKPDDVWIVLHNKVYDITKYLEDHPGGSAILIEVGGTDATEAFEETGHSDEAREALAKYLIGDLPSEVHGSKPPLMNFNVPHSFKLTYLVYLGARRDRRSLSSQLRAGFPNCSGVG